MGASGFTLLDDSGLPCLASGLGGVIVGESVVIADVCQDPDNLHICYLDISVMGPYNYTAKVYARWVGDHTLLGDWIEITSTFIENYRGYQDPLIVWSSPTLKIDTFCSSVNTRIAFNCGTLIDDDMSATQGDLGSFASAPAIEFKIELAGAFPSEAFENTGGCHDPQLEEDAVTSLQVFASEDPTSNVFTYNKGVTPDPYYIYFDPTTNELKIVYASLGTVACPCAINCVEPDLEDFEIPICDDELQVITVQATDIIGDPTDINIVFKDPIGNFTDASVHTVAGVTPRPPSPLVAPKPLHVQIVIPYASINGKAINPNKVKYQLLKYTNNSDNFVILKDWSSKKWDVVYDRDVRQGHIYGYAVKFKGEFNEESYLSTWKTVNL
jgi:hypothetical protein